MIQTNKRRKAISSALQAAGSIGGESLAILLGPSKQSNLRKLARAAGHSLVPPPKDFSGGPAGG